METKKVHLVLGSGGARGLAHIGVIETLEEAGYEMISIAGSSMGAVVGGIYAAGYLQAYKEWMLQVTRKKLFNILDFTLTRQGFLKGERIFSILKDVTGDQQIENMNIPFTAVATNMMRNEEVHYTSGDLYKALRASIAIPGIFTPVMENGQLLVDGGVLNPLPLNLVRKKENEIIVAVNLNGSSNRPIPGLNPPVEKEAVSALMKWLAPLMQPGKDKQKDLLPVSTYSLKELLLSTYRLTQDRLTEMILKTYPPDLLVQIPRSSCSTFEFYKAKSQVELGRETCARVLAQQRSG